MHRHWNCEERCISTSFTQLKISTLYTCCFRGGGGVSLAAQREITKRKRVDVLPEHREMRLAAERESQKKNACRGITRVYQRNY